MRENRAVAPKNRAIRLLFDRRPRLEFRVAKITSDAGLPAVRELDEMMGLTDMAAVFIVEGRTGKNIQHQIPGLLRQSVYARLTGYEDVNDQEALARDPAMRAVIGKRALERTAASSGTSRASRRRYLSVMKTSKPSPPSTARGSPERCRSPGRRR
ncbi:MAG: transposase [Actinobacteria bacterium]|nr:transposase [Actinomycetota bacterium]